MEYNDIVNNLFKDIKSEKDNILTFKAPWETNKQLEKEESSSSSDSQDDELDIDTKYDNLITERNNIYSIKKELHDYYNDITSNEDNSDDTDDTNDTDDTDDSDNLFDNDDIEDYTKTIKIKNIDEVELEENPLEHLHNQENLSIDLFNKEVEEYDYYIIIENGFKNSSGVYTIFDPSNTVQTVLLDRTFNNIVKADLVECIIKNNTGSSYETDPSGTPFVIVEVDEFGSNYESNNSNVAKAFKTLSYYVDCNTGTTQRHYTDLANDIDKYFNPRKTIDTITLRFKKPDGTNFIFSGSSITTATYWLTFKITCLERRLKTSYINKTTG